MAHLLHYRLTTEEWLQACDALKPAELKVLYYLRTIDPWGDKCVEIGVTALAETLNLNKGTVSRALNKLDQTGWINLEITIATVKLKTKDNSTKAPVLSVDNALPSDNGVVSGSSALSTDNADDRQTTQMIATQHLASETQASQDFQIPLNSLNLNRQTTHLDSECSVCGDESISQDQTFDCQEAELERQAPDRPQVMPLKSETGNQPVRTEKEATSTPAILQSAKKLGVNVDDRQLLRVAKQWPERVEDAIAALEEKSDRVKSPTRFLVRAIRDGWQPETPQKPKVTEGFHEWYCQAYDRYLVSASHRFDGILKVWMACEKWVPYDLLKTLSWDEIAARFGRPSQECYGQ